MEDESKSDEEWFEKGAFVLPEVARCRYPHFARDMVAAEKEEAADVD
jgi:hypothetical protein